MELNDKTTAPDSAPIQPANETDAVPVNSVNAVESRPLEERVDTTEATAETGSPEDAIPEDITSGSAPKGKRERGLVGDTPFDRHTEKSEKIDWSVLGLAFFGGIGANFFLGMLMLFLQRLAGSPLNGPGVLAILTGLFVIVQLLVPFSAETRRVMIAFWAGLLCGYATIWFVVRPLLVGTPR